MLCLQLSNNIYHTLNVNVKWTVIYLNDSCSLSFVGRRIIFRPCIKYLEVLGLNSCNAITEMAEQDWFWSGVAINSGRSLQFSQCWCKLFAEDAEVSGLGGAGSVAFQGRAVISLQVYAPFTVWLTVLNNRPSLNLAFRGSISWDGVFSKQWPCLTNIHNEGSPSPGLCWVLGPVMPGSHPGSHEGETLGPHSWVGRPTWPEWCVASDHPQHGRVGHLVTSPQPCHYKHFLICECDETAS